MALSRNLELAAAAVVASIATASLIFSYQHRRRRQHIRDIKRNAETLGRERSIDLDAHSFAKRPLRDGFQSEAEEHEHEQLLMREQLSRNISFLGEPAMERLQNAFVVVVGAGGVGSWAALMLARSGVRRMRIIDFDQVTLSSLNRHAVATRADVGTPKVVAIRDHLRRIVPLIEIDACVELFSKDMRMMVTFVTTVDGPDMVLDCIDNIDTKIDLLEYCHRHGLTVMSAMGAGAKADPSRIQLADISDTNEDHLARAVRRRLKQRKILTGIDVVYSTEKPGQVNLLPLDESQAQESDEFAILPDFRVRIMPVLGPLPAMFGMAMATYTICKLSGHTIEPLSVKLRGKLYDRMQRELIVREEKVAGIPFDRDDIAYIVEEVWHGKSVLSGTSDKLCLTRWDRRRPISFQNCVCLTKSEATRHDAHDPDRLHELYSAEELALVEKRFTEERYYSQWR
ncbi:hypothetical protein SYNPS1DRAFT_20178 [Syncephalis pseudoplumigaleata]|uniref:THIF-type NAD/FAD binding fold domain-containing protein n=1 Tax=Syncephalis pseudoplumigaleata TaxID=1712513 RepID=A0A4P9YRB2_9FUNG|nr:hypothetical protein SYNPS1DRAFT_20178 [Syncephalis pseudoplumigaleata]|eukprot:RKP22357.1 hypothetical protein SYNPS1DRAFT_20178 [Syncephalis pseudoplumigaleata]